ncbi:hypothetical protein ACFE04_002495 [Oxalis oulophora]
MAVLYLLCQCIPTGTASAPVRPQPLPLVHAQPLVVGLDAATIDAFRLMKYQQGQTNAISIPVDCLVCLMPFEKEDDVRLLPKCEHVFHPQCIKTWLLKNKTCPLCRREQ